MTEDGLAVDLREGLLGRHLLRVFESRGHVVGAGSSLYGWGSVATQFIRRYACSIPVSLLEHPDGERQVVSHILAVVLVLRLDAEVEPLVVAT